MEGLATRGDRLLIELAMQSVVMEAPRELCFEVVAGAVRRMERLSESEFVAEFITTYRGRKIRTVELVRVYRPQAVHYRWLNTEKKMAKHREENG